MKRKCFLLFLALITMLMLLGTVQPVSANAPDIILMEANDTIADIGTCQDPIALQIRGYYQSKWWYDDLGRVSMHFEGLQHVNFELTGNGQHLTFNNTGPAHYRLDWVSETQAESYIYVSGPSDFIVVPKLGPIFGSAGLFIHHYHITSTENGPVFEDQGIVFDKGLFAYDLTAFCAYFGSSPLAP